jgi:hypothetical protein
VTLADEDVVAALEGHEGYLVGGCVRDDLLGRAVDDLDVVCRDPERAARAYRERVGGALVVLSARHGAWRVAHRDGRVVDFAGQRGSIADDLRLRDFTANAIARAVGGGGLVDPTGGRDDLAAGLLRAVSETVFRDDPLRLLRAVRLEDELGLALEPDTEALVRGDAHLVAEPAGERILAELRRLSTAGWRRLGELGLLKPLGGDLTRLPLAAATDHRELALVAVLGDELERLPIPNDLRRLVRAVGRATAPVEGSPRALHRFRREVEPYAVEALVLHGRADLVPALLAARAADPVEPLLRGDELGVPPGPEVGRLLEAIAEERAAGTISTREEARALVRRLRG